MLFTDDSTDARKPPQPTQSIKKRPNSKQHMQAQNSSYKSNEVILIF